MFDKLKFVAKLRQAKRVLQPRSGRRYVAHGVSRG